MDWNDIDRLRDPGFTVARRGYDAREVDRLLGSLVDWLETDAARELGDGGQAQVRARRQVDCAHPPDD